MDVSGTAPEHRCFLASMNAMKDSIASLDAVARRLWRRLVRGALALPLVLPVLGGAAQAGYPDKPIRMVVPYPAGGAADVVARGGRVRALAVTGKTRLRSAPEIPTTEEAGLQGLERNPAEGTILVGVSGHICEGKLTPPVDTVIAVTVQRLPPPPAFEDAPESVAEQPAEAAEDPPAPEGEPAPEAPRRRRRAPA